MTPDSAIRSENIFNKRHCRLNLLHPPAFRCPYPCQTDVETNPQAIFAAIKLAVALVLIWGVRRTVMKKRW